MLLQTKLLPPPKPPTLVARHQLTQVLDAGLQRKLTLLSAPAGFGKTTLVATWLQDVNIPCAWLSLDESDNDPVRFWRYVVAALQSIRPDLSRLAEDLFSAGQTPPLELIVTALINAVVADSPEQSLAPLALVLDDYHVITERAIHRSLDLLLDHLPPQLHLVITTRVDPPLKLSRRLGRQEMVQLRAADLRFNAQETTHFLNAVMQLGLSKADVDALLERTEGWIVSLQLAALSLQHHPDRTAFIETFAGDDRYVVDYLVDEVFAQQPEAVRDFLVKTSILDRFCGPLCDVLMNAKHGQINGQAMLDRLEQSNLFLVPLDNRRQWYRYHHLFADMLRQRLRERSPGADTPLHRTASVWFEHEGLDVEALHHALAGEDWDRAIRLTEHVAEPTMKRGHFRRLRHLLEHLPSDRLYAHPRLCLTLARSLNLSGAPDQSEPYLDRAEVMLNPETDSALLGIVASARAHRSVFLQDYAETIAHAERALTLLPKTDLLNRSLTLMHLSVALTRLGHLTRAEKLLPIARDTALACGNQFTVTTAITFMGMVQLLRGRLRQAHETAQQVYHTVPVSLRERSLVFHVLEVALAYEEDRLAEAEEMLNKALQMGRQTGRLASVGPQLFGRLAQIHWACGDPGTASDFAHEALRLAERHGLPHSLRFLQALRGQFWLKEGNLEATARLCNDLGIHEKAPLTYPDEPLFRVLVRLRRAERRYEAALALVERLLEQATADTRVYDVVQLWTLKAAVQFEVGSQGAALETLGHALAEARSEGYVRTFLDEGAVMGRLLYQASLCDVEADEARRLLAAFRAAPASEAVGEAALQLIEPLSDRELDVLHLLAEDLTNQAVADRLFVSLNTIKTHTKHIYGKLGVRSRREAVKQARALGLL